ncbi:MAG: HoxN/HupN/NixA family nickel/cobalt transporter [Streptosporangiaceae bacterium]
MTAATESTGSGLRRQLRFDRDELPRLAGLLGGVALLHVVGFGLFAYYNGQPQYHNLTGPGGGLIYAGAGALAYSFGLRHAFDADHISAIDDTTRLMLQKGRRPLGVGFFFSLGHSTIVFALAVGVAFATRAAAHFQHSFQDVGGTIGASVSGLFLYLVAGLNLVILVGILRLWGQLKRGTYEPDRLEQMLLDRGLMKRIFRGRFARSFDHSWQLYPVGLLFGLGFDTASEVALLGLSAAAAAGAATGALSPLAIIALPIIFAAGMSLMDTLDGVFMSKAYSWAFTSPVRKVYYNITMTGVSVFVAFVIGTIELVGVLADRLGLAAVQPFAFVSSINLGSTGYFIVGVFLVAWLGSMALWKVRRIEQRYGGTRPHT